MIQKLKDLVVILPLWYIILLYLIVTVLIVAVTLLSSKYLGVTDIGDQYAIVQTVLAIAVFIPTFYALVRGLRERSILSVNIITEPTFYANFSTTNVDGESSELYIPVKLLSFEIINNGNIVTNWFIVRISISLDARYKEFLSADVSKVVGDNSNWNQTDLSLDGDHKVTLYTFLSNGQYAAYVDDGLRLLNFVFMMNEEEVPYPMEIPINISITSDKGSRYKRKYTMIIESP